MKLWRKKEEENWKSWNYSGSVEGQDGYESSCLSSQLHCTVNDDDESEDGDEVDIDANDNNYNDDNDNNYNDDKVHSLAAMEAGIVTMALTNPLQVFCHHNRHQNRKTFGTSWWINRYNKNHSKLPSDCLFCEQHLRNIFQVLRTRMVLCSQVTEIDYKRFFFERMITRDCLGQIVTFHLTCELWMQNMT